ncbi:MAG: hypothetical protein KGL48_07605 [Sphingomonadales bacterium]|nr:hypothetical protein [Sphingomonadales bacterium]MDE2568788.1 hypothetical protein [Sphingomonadales bacterium]
MAEIQPVNDDRLAGEKTSPDEPAYSRDAIQLVRTLQTVTMSLSQMADQKASILMGATFVVFTISVGQARAGNFPYALSVLAFFAFASALCAVYAVLPSIGARPKAPPPGFVPNKLFFGVFAQIPQEEWVEDVMEDLQSDAEVYRLILRDIYQNGVVLQRKKYKYLGIAYRIFVVGLCLTLAIFVVEQGFHLFLYEGGFRPAPSPRS